MNEQLCLRIAILMSFCSDRLDSSEVTAYNTVHKPAFIPTLASILF